MPPFVPMQTYKVILKTYWVFMQNADSVATHPLPCLDRSARLRPFSVGTASGAASSGPVLLAGSS